MEEDLKDHLVHHFLAKAQSRQDGSANCTHEFQKCATLGNPPLPWGDYSNSFSSLSTEVLSSWVDPSLCYTTGLYFLRCKILLVLIRFYLTLSACPGFPAGLPPFQSLQFGLIGKCHQNTLDPIFHIIYKCSKLHWRQCLSLGIHTCARLPVWISFLPARLVFWVSWWASSPPIAQTTCLDHKPPVSPGGGCGKPYWKLWRNPGRPWAALALQELSALLCHRGWSGLSGLVCPWWIILILKWQLFQIADGITVFFL